MSSFKRILLIFFWICTLGCSPENSVTERKESIEVPSEMKSNEPITGLRIAWDFETQTLISEENNTDYNGYARLVELDDETLLVVYESSGDVVVKRSEDKGKTWSEPLVVVPGAEGVNMATPDILQLQNGAVLVTYNPRPSETAPPTKKFLIKSILSHDGGRSWNADQVIYEGDTEFANGVWEPSALELPSGEIQVFFSNESVYQDSDEQNISLVRSGDHGISWSKEPEIASFRKGSRDGMPSPLFLEDQNQIVFSIEDNGNGNQFKPYIIRNHIDEDWSEVVHGNSGNRTYALEEQLEESEYAGAPYLARLNTGETLLSYQGTDQRNGNDLNNADMKVAIGSEHAENFNRISTPFLIPEGKSALWNSLAVLEDNTVVALTTTNAFSSTNASEVWMIKGRIVPELTAKKEALEVDGKASEDIWQKDFPVFIGQKSATQLFANISTDEDHLYVLSKVSDTKPSVGSDNVENNDGMTIYLDPSDQNLVGPGVGIYKIVISAANEVGVFEGKDAQWNKIELPEIKTEVTINDQGYIQEVSIPWNAIGGRPESNASMGFNIELTERGKMNYKEGISATKSDVPFTWLSLNTQ